MAYRIAINGFGRIGRLVLRAMAERKITNAKVVAINDLSPVATRAHLFAHDSVHGAYSRKVRTTKSTMDIGFGSMQALSLRNPHDLPWKKLGVDLVLECTGLFTKREDAARHITAGAPRVLISAPATGADLTVVYGVNNKKIREKHRIVSNASCTTNCLAPLALVLHQAFGLKYGYMTTVHAVTGDQPTVDTVHSDLRRARAANISMIPTSTGAAKAIGLVLPELAGRLDGAAIRVPTANVSLVDLVFQTQKPVTTDSINKAFEKASKGSLKNILGLNDEAPVSVDLNHNPLSSIVDVEQTQTMGKNMARVLSWYDNEWGFSNRMVDTMMAMLK